MPESPKFLMSVGQNKEALQIFKRVYRINTGKSEATFPIKELVDEIKLHQNEDHIHGGLVTANRTKTQALREGWQQLKPLFFPPLLPKLILVCFIQFLLMMTVNTIKIWLPQLFQAINDFQFKYENKSSSLCEMIEMLSPKHASIPCTVNFKNSSVYINSMIVSLVTIGGYLLAAVVINKVGRKKILHVAFLISGSCAIAMYFSSKNVVILVLSCIFASIGSICSNVMQTITIDLFPTTLRSMTLSILMMAGRSGILIGNLLFPLLLSMGCGFVFFSSGGLLLGCAVLSIVLPNTERKSLQ
ncbi:unnamed protein product [Brassicogethes aeneus]|uniref:Uncharacterized protein n=1 Tax=Brassicogethes aeneus TaxID=1431903 RepID=A0A9P0B3P5_BRAAE|nr:unnamed protein product [Brassicogethes aeneus]